MKKVMMATIVVAISVISGWNISQSKSEGTLSDMALANVEALASGEEGGSTSWKCWSSLISGAGAWRCGNPCVWEPNGYDGSGKSTCYSY
jgi:hypothetical protein